MGVRLRERMRERAWRLPPQAIPGIFSAGLDITEMFGRSEERLGEFWRAVQQLWILLYGSRLVTVAAVNVSRPAGLGSPSCRKTPLAPFGAALPSPPFHSPPPSGKGRPVRAQFRSSPPRCSVWAARNAPQLLSSPSPWKPSSFEALGPWGAGHGGARMVKQGPPPPRPWAEAAPFLAGFQPRRRLPHGLVM